MMAELGRGNRLPRPTSVVIARARRAWRSGRDIPVLGALFAAADRIWWYRRIAKSGLVDVEFYAAQRGRRRSGLRRSIWHYVTRGHRLGLSLNPLVDELIAGRDLPEPARVPAIYAYLVSDRATVRINPWWGEPQAAREDYGHDSGALAPLEQAWSEPSRQLDLTFGEQHFTVTVRDYREWAIDSAREWASNRRATNPRVVGAPKLDAAVSIARFIQRQDRDFDQKLVVAGQLATDADVVVAAVAPDASQWISLAIISRLGVPLRRIALPGRTSFAQAFERVEQQTTGKTLVSVDPRTSVSREELVSLAQFVGPTRAVAPAALAADGTVAALGAAPVKGDIYRILSGHPAEDLDAFGTEPLSVPLLSGYSFAVEREALQLAGGLVADPRSLELVSQRLRQNHQEFELLVLPSVRATHHAPLLAFTEPTSPSSQAWGDESPRVAEILRAARFDVQGWLGGAEGRPEPVLRWLSPGADSLRWAIKICAPAGPSGDVWGDTHFALGLAKALRRLRQTVSIDSFDARDRSTSYLDDVTVVIRGPYRIDPPSNSVRIEWIISHPDLITPEEVAAFDVVFAASRRWAAKAARLFNKPIEPLLECTDTDQFYPRGLPRGSDIVFVGTARGIARPSVVAPLRAGIPVLVYGPDWRTYIPASAIAATTIPNRELSERYETASIVLNDHWPAMRREGFMAMRPFDVVAAGGRVISEDVDDLVDLFGGAVVAYNSEERLIELLRSDPSEIFPNDRELIAISERIRAEHSFDVRARDLLAAARRKQRGR